MATELAGTATGGSSVGGLLVFPREQNRYLYLLANVGVGFDDTDNNSGSTGFVSQSYPDGTLIGQNRYLYLLANIRFALRSRANTFSSMTVSTRPRPWKPRSPRSW